LRFRLDGTYQANADLATVTFDISAQDKDLKATYEQASSSMPKIINRRKKWPEKGKYFFGGANGSSVLRR
jgi:hypothetical protein